MRNSLQSTLLLLALAATLASPTKPSRAYGEDLPRFEGIESVALAPAGNGPASNPDATAPSADLSGDEALPADLAARVDAYRRLVERLEAESQQPLAAAASCADYAGLWLELLGNRGCPVQYAQTAGVGTVLVDGRPRRADKLHAFVVDRSLCQPGDDGSREIVIDPTYTQFLEPGECLFEDSRADHIRAGGRCEPDEALERLPRVFVGTRSELLALYRTLRPRLRSASTSGLDPDAGRYDPGLLASLHYSFGANARLRTNLAFQRP